MSEAPSDVSATSTSPPKVTTTPRAKQAWQKAAKNVKPQGDVGNNKGDGTPKSKQPEQSPKTKQGNWHELGTKSKQDQSGQNKKECERKKSTTSENTVAVELESTLERLKEIEVEYEKSKQKIEGLEAKCNQQFHETRSLNVDLRDKDDIIGSLKKEVGKHLSRIEDLKKELTVANAKVRGVTNMEWKAMEYEKVNIMNENLKQKLNDQQSENRDLERRLRDRDKDISEKERQIEVQEEQIATINDKLLDMRLQVREEAIKNSKLDERLEVFADVQRNLEEKDKEVDELTKKLEDTEILLQHAKKSWREEREKMKNFEGEKKEDQRLNEEMDMTLSENMTLKRLVIAKDAVLIQKSQALENLKNMLNNHDGDSIEVDMVRNVLEKKPVIKPTFPVGNKAKQEQYKNGCNGTITNSWLNDPTDKTGKKSSRRGDLFQAILGNDNDKRFFYPAKSGRVATGRRPQTAVVKPQTYKSSSFINFRSDDDSALESNRTDSSSMSMKKWHTAKDVRNENNKHSSMNGSTKMHYHHKSQSNIEAENSKIRRSKSTDNRICPQDLDSRPSSPGTWSQKTMSVSTTQGSIGSGSISAVMLKAAPQKDRKYSRLVCVGDRVVVDMARHKEKRKTNYQAGVLKFIGNLDKEQDCYRIYIGVRLDDPNGDTDGLYKGKRYFKVTSSHGKFLRITKIVSIYNKESCKFEDIEQQLDENSNQEEDNQSKQFQLDI